MSNDYDYWVKEIELYPDYLDELNLSVYQRKKFTTHLRRLRNETLKEAENERVWIDHNKDKNWMNKAYDLQDARSRILEYYSKEQVLSQIQERVEAWGQTKTQRGPKPAMNFIDYLTMDEAKRQPFADKLKREFPGICGKRLGVLLKAMEAEKHICIRDRQRKYLYKHLREFFGWEICSETILNKTISGIRRRQEIMKDAFQDEEFNNYKRKVRNIYKAIQ